MNKAAAEVRALLQAAIARLDEEPPIPDQDQKVIDAGILLVRSQKPRSKADAARFTEAFLRGDEAWLVMHALPGDGLHVEAHYSSTDPFA